MKIVKMDTDGVIIDGDYMELNDITADLLDTIVNSALTDDVIFDIHPRNKSPLAEFFRMVEKDTQPGASYRKNYEALHQK